MLYNLSSVFAPNCFGIAENFPQLIAQPDKGFFVKPREVSNKLNLFAV
jgi:hypothetical protein